jgi:DNA-binding NarL/FixJ family response regulator
VRQGAAAQNGGDVGPVVFCRAASAHGDRVRACLDQALGEAKVVEVEDIWTLARSAPRSSAVVLSGAVEGASTATIVRFLRHRHAELPLIVLRAENDPPAVVADLEAGATAVWSLEAHGEAVSPIEFAISMSAWARELARLRETS